MTQIESTPEPLKVALAELITGVTKTAGEAKAFLVAEIPDVVHQLLVWKMCESLAWCAFALAFATTTALLIRKLIRRGHELDWALDDEPALAARVFVTGAITIAAIFTVPCGFNLTWLQIWLAPKIYLLEYAKELVK